MLSKTIIKFCKVIYTCLTEPIKVTLINNKHIENKKAPDPEGIKAKREFGYWPSAFLYRVSSVLFNFIFTESNSQQKPFDKFCKK